MSVPLSEQIKWMEQQYDHYVWLCLFQSNFDDEAGVCKAILASLKRLQEQEDE